MPLEQAVEGDQSGFWEADPEVIEDLDENPHFYGQARDLTG